MEGPRRRVRALMSSVRLPIHRLGREARACPACASPAIVPLDEVPLYETIEGSRVGFATGCRDCGLLFVNPLPDVDTLKAFYSPGGTWGQAQARDRRDTLERQAERVRGGFRKAGARRRGRDYLLDAIGRYVPVFEPRAGMSVLDFGCGDGKLLNVLLDLGWNTYGIEPSSDVAFLRHTRLERVPPEPRFDFVVLHHVLEHIPRPLDLLTALAASMNAGASIFISVPRLDTLPEHRDFRYCLNGRTHPVSFSELCLRELLGRAGLTFVAALNDPELDAQLTDGVPLRMRVVACKADGSPAHVGQPLSAALRALRHYRQHGDSAQSWFDRFLPVRTRAFLRDRERRRRAPASAA
jgi:SAM-dependent methyltransferase